MPISVGTRLGPYEIVAPIGSGGMGEVYRAQDTKLNRDVAIKVLPAALANDVDYMARSQREAQVLAALNHPNIAAIYGLEEHAIVMELVEGPTLANRIAQGLLPIEEALPIAKQIAEALEAAHEKGIIHRDLKPGNIKVTPEGVVKVLDFGLAKTAGANTTSNASISPTLTIRATEAGFILGTAAYMSPEQAAGRPVDKRADIWSFGVVLWEMLTGHRLFEGETVSHTLADVLRTPIDFNQLPTKTPSTIDDLLRRCLDRDIKTRLRDIGEARIVIAKYLADPSAAAESARPVSGSRAPVAWALTTIFAVALAIALWVPWRRPPAPAPINQFVIPPPEKATFGDFRASLAISPDGRQLVFIASSSGPPVLWVRPLDSLAARRLAGTEDAGAPFWSPDSKSIGFFSRGKLKRIDASGGPVQSLADATYPPVGGTWNHDGVIVFARSTADALYSVPAAGGAVQQVTHLDQARQERAHQWPFFLPDGHHFLFLSRAGQSLGLFVGSLTSPEVKPISGVFSAAMYSPPGYLLFQRDTTLMAQPFDAAHLSTSGDAVPIVERVAAFVAGTVGFTVSASGTLVYRSNVSSQTHLLWVDRAGKPISEAAPAGTYNNIALSPDEKRLAFDRFQNQADVWLMDLQRHITQRFTFQQSNVPLWSPDGRTVAFASARTGMLDIYQRPSNASAPEQVLFKLEAPPILYPSDWSSDGRYLAYYRADPKTQTDLWVLPLFGDKKPFPVAHSEFNESEGQFSPDVRWMAYESDESGMPQIYVQSFPVVTGKWQISTDGGSQPRWRKDGKELFYITTDGKLMAVTVKTGAAFEFGAPRPLFEANLASAIRRQAYVVSADGQRFLLNTPLDTAAQPLTIVQNWTGLLKK